MDLSLRSELLLLLEEIATEPVPGFILSMPAADYVDKILANADIIPYFKEGRLAAVVAAYCNDMESREIFVTLVAVHPRCRGYGIAGHLMNAALRIGRNRGFCCARLRVCPTNDKAISLYESIGFLLVARHDAYIEMKVDF